MGHLGLIYEAVWADDGTGAAVGNAWTDGVLSDTERGATAPSGLGGGGMAFAGGKGSVVRFLCWNCKDEAHSSAALLL